MSVQVSALDGALAARARGESIVATTADKRPWFPWKRFQNERPTERQLRDWAKNRRAAGFAVITGQISGLIVLDFDGEDGAALLGQLGLKPHIKTGSGGSHVRMPHPGIYIPTQNSEVTKTLQERWHGLDIRADGGLAVEWGENANGSYEQLRDLTDLTPLSAIPEELAADLRLIEVKKKNFFSAKENGQKKKTKVTHPGRHAHLMQIGCAMRGRGHEERAILEELRRVNRTECDPPKDEAEVDTLVCDTIARYPRGGPAGDRVRDTRDELRVKLAEALKIGTGGYRVTGAELHGARGPTAICVIAIVDEHGQPTTIEVGRYGNLLHPATLSGLVAAYTGVGESFTQKECAAIAGLVSRLAAHELLIDEGEIVVDYGLAWLRECTTTIPVEVNKQGARWSTWVELRDMNPVASANLLTRQNTSKGFKTDDAEAVAAALSKSTIAANAAMGLDSAGRRYVHSAWFYEFTRRDLGSQLGAAELYSRMCRAGWERPRGRGRLKATEPGGGREIQLPVLIIPPGWEANQ